MSFMFKKKKSFKSIFGNRGLFLTIYKCLLFQDNLNIFIVIRFKNKTLEKMNKLD